MVKRGLLKMENASTSLVNTSFDCKCFFRFCSCCKSIYHSSISIFGLYFFGGKDWWGYPDLVYIDYPMHDIEPAMSIYYILQAAYNTDAMISLMEISFEFRDSRIRWSKTARGDFPEMMAHHVITNMLIYISAYFRFQRMGIMVLMVHDISDVPVDLSKLANFVKWKTTTIVCFLTMMVTWAYARLYLFPFVIAKTIIFRNFHILEHGFSPMLWIAFRHPFYVGIVALCLLHYTWFFMFVKMLVTLVTKNECHDYSEHKSGEQHNAVKKKKSKKEE